jgi:hypothetical protein
MWSLFLLGVVAAQYATKEGEILMLSEEPSGEAILVRMEQRLISIEKSLALRGGRATETAAKSGARVVGNVVSTDHQREKHDSDWDLRICLISAYFGDPTKMASFPYTLQSMGTNPKNVQFIIVTVQEDPRSASKITDMAAKLGVTNVKVLALTIHEWAKRVKDKLLIDVPWDMTWYYKLNDYKPTFGVLFADIIEGFDWWGWVDLDVIFGNFATFRHLFHKLDRTSKQYEMITGCWFRTCGPITMIKSTPENNQIYQKQKSYMAKLLEKKPQTLDENGNDGMTHWFPKEKLTWDDTKLTGGPYYGHQLQAHGSMIVNGDSIKTHFGPTGVVTWFEGELTMLKGHYPVLVFHKPIAKGPPKIPKGALGGNGLNLQESLLEDSFKYGYVLPGFDPLNWRGMCGRLENAKGRLDCYRRKCECPEPEHCFYDDLCQDKKGGEPYNGLGCFVDTAGSTCRHCGYGEYKDILC